MKLPSDETKLRSYVILWCLAQVVLDWKFGSLSNHGVYEYVQAVLIVATLAVDSRWLTAVTFLARTGGLFVRVPNTFDAEYLGAITDLTVGLAVLLNLSPETAIRAELGIFYLAAAFWKVNSAFLDPRSSCGTTYAVQLISAMGLPSVQFWAVRVMPWFTILLEGGIGVAALARWSQLAVVLCLALHTGIALTPPPNNISGFGVVAAVRFFWLVPAIPWRRAASVAVPFAAVLLGACTRLHSSPSVQSVAITNLDFPAGIFGATAGALLTAMAQPKSTAPGSRPLFVALGVVLTIAWSFGTIIFGLLDGASPNMFSNIRMVGGSNHVVLPTGLLQRWYYDDPSSVFGGGILRVEESNSTVLNAIHPGEMTSLLSIETREILRQLGYPARFFNSAVANVVGSHVMPHYDVRPQYTLPAFELHRVLRLDPNPVTITVTKLDGPTGDESWRRTSGNRTATLIYNPYPNLVSCHLHSSPCDDRDLFHLTFLAATTTSSWLNFIGDKLQMWNSYVLFDDPEVGGSSELFCYGS